MSVITAIEVQKKDKNRYNLYLDNKFFSGVSSETIVKNHLKVGMELDAKKLGEILSETERQKALAKSLDYISKSIKTRKQIKEYLLSKGYLEEVVYFVLEKLTEYGLIDDKEYSVRYIEAYSKTQGRKLIEYKLMMKGVRKEDVILAFEETNDSIDNFDNVYNLALKHLKGKEKTKENYAKTYRYLAGKGYLFEDIDRAISKIRDEE